MAGRLRYHFEDDQKLLQFILDELKDDNQDAKFPLGNNIWKLAAEREVTRHTFQSMLGRFKKILLPQLRRRSALVPDSDRLYMMEKWGYEVNKAFRRKKTGGVFELSEDDEDLEYLNGESDTPSVNSVYMENQEEMGQSIAEPQLISEQPSEEPTESTSKLSENLLIEKQIASPARRHKLFNGNSSVESALTAQSTLAHEEVAGKIVSIENGEIISVEPVTEVVDSEDLYKLFDHEETRLTKSLMFDWVKDGRLTIDECDNYLKLFNEICRLAKVYKTKPEEIVDRLTQVEGDFNQLNFEN